MPTTRDVYKKKLVDLIVSENRAKKVTHLTQNVTKKLSFESSTGANGDDDDNDDEEEDADDEDEEQPQSNDASRRDSQPPQSADSCCVCLDEPPETVLIPCGHFLCQSCAPNFQTCPICRSPVGSRHRTFR